MVGCDVEDQTFDEGNRALSEQEFDATLEDNSLAAAPELLDEDVGALFEGGEPTLRDVISLVDVESLLPGLSIEDLDRPVVLDLSDPGAEDAAIGPARDSEMEVGPVFAGEAACATASVANPDDGAPTWMSPPPACSYAYDGATSPNTSYGQPQAVRTSSSQKSAEPEVAPSRSIPPGTVSTSMRHTVKSQARRFLRTTGGGKLGVPMAF